MSVLDDLQRDNAALESFLQPEAPEVGKLTLRSFSAATMAMMQQTRNEWLRRVPIEQMENPSFATLAWLYIQGAPEGEVRRTIWNEQLFRESVLKWGDANITAEDLAKAEVQIGASLGLIAAAQVEVKEKPEDPDLPPSSAPEQPPNS